MAKPQNGTSIRLRFNSAFEMLDLVQVVSDQVGRLLHFDDDALTWMEVAVRESVINAIKHGNRHDAAKHVIVEFHDARPTIRTELVIAVRDQGRGFRPRSAARSAGAREPPEVERPRHLLHAQLHGRRQPARVPDGGMEVRMVKKLPAQP